MFFAGAFLLLSLLMILLAAEGFTNGVEVLGRRFSFSQAVVGSILAAVGTALPETILPLVAILSSHQKSAHEIGVGAILGAPFMLATVAFFLVGLTVVISHARGRRAIEIDIEPHTFKRDMTFFIVMYSAAIFVPLFLGRASAIPLAVILVMGYLYYVYLTIQGESAAIEHFEGLHILKLQGKFRQVEMKNPQVFWIVFQIALALGLMVFGAHIFVQNLSVISVGLGMSPLLFALLIAPIATELPEKFNSVTWVLKKKDSLAIGNITGAMVFQATFPVSVGLVMTSWQISGMALVSAVLALVSAGLALGFVIFKKRLSPYILLLGGVFYAAYAFLVVMGWK